MSSSRDKKKPSASGPTIRTLADLNRQSGGDSDSDSDGPPEYYTGGEKSGMLVQDPSKGNDEVDAIFNQARETGAIQGAFEQQQESSSSRSFTGTGRLLSGQSVPPAPQPPQNVSYNIYFWNNGFTVNDGPLRSYDDPENAAFLESIRNTECPEELEPADRRSKIHVNLLRRDDKFPEPVQQVSFRGVGRILGNETTTTDPPVPQPAVAVTSTTNVPLTSVGFSVDSSLPSTSLQLRLADGTRLVARFNYHHTVGDIRAFIDASRPGVVGSYQLQTVGFPPKQLTDVTKTIQEEGLENSVLIQKL